MEGGSKRKIEEEWTLDDYAEIRRYWQTTPPPHISLMLIAKAHGAKFEKLEEPEGGSLEYQSAEGGLSVAEIAARIKPPSDLSSGDVSASREAIRLMFPEPDAN
jgi:hypothetical protein